MTEIHHLSAELQGLLHLERNITGYSTDEILVQSLFLHYPHIFHEIETDVRLFIILDPEDRIRLKLLSSLYDIPTHQVIPDLLVIDTSNGIDPVFPDNEQLESVLEKADGYMEFPPAQRSQVLVENLIIKYHLTIQPQDVFTPALQGINDWFTMLEMSFDHENAIRLLNAIRLDVYDIRRLDYSLRLLLYNKVNLVQSLSAQN